MAEIIPILHPRIFTELQAEQLLPTIKRITERADTDARIIQEQLRFIPPTEPIFKKYAIEFEMVIQRWVTKVKKLGAKPTGIWIVNFETENGCFSWRLGDENISFFNAHEVE